MRKNYIKRTNPQMNNNMPFPWNSATPFSIDIKRTKIIKTIYISDISDYKLVAEESVNMNKNGSRSMQYQV